MTIAVVDSGGANIASILHALRRLGTEPAFTADAGIIRDAERVILPGVGAAGSAMARLEANQLVPVLRRLRQPVLGICLGMQLLFDTTEEGDVPMLGVIPARVTRLPEAAGIRVPHMGWNFVRTDKNNHLTTNLNEDWFYFVHSYAAPVGDWTVATSDHGGAFSAAVRRDNFSGVQFHPERSAAAGARLLRNFMQSP